MNRFFFLVLVGAFGALALVTQVVLLRQLLVAFYGSEMVIALVLAGWLAGIFLGAKAMGFIKPARRLKVWLSLAAPLWLAVLFTLLAISFFISGLTGLTPGEVAPLHMVLVWVLILTGPASLFVGGLFVLAGSYWNDNFNPKGARRPGVGGTIFWVESAGSCLGLFFYTFFLVGRAGPIQVLALFSGVVLLAQSLALTRRVRTRLILPALILSAGALVHFTGLGDKLDLAADTARFSRANPAYTLAAVRDTPYQHLTLAKRGGETALFGNQIFMASWPNPYHYQVLTLLYLTEARRFDHVLLAGQGPGGFIHELLRRQVKRLVYVALDPAETSLVASHLSLAQAKDLTDPRLEIIHNDLRRYLAKPGGEPFDLIIVNAPDPDNALINRLYTRDFFQAAKARLSPQGVLVTSVSGAENYWSPELLSYGLTLYQTLQAVFPEVIITPGDRHYFFAAAAKGVVTDDTKVLARRYRTRGFESPYFTPRSFPLFFPPTGLEYIKSRLAEARSGRLNTDAVPLSYFLRLVWWEKMTGGPWTRLILGRAAQVKTWGPWAAGLLCLPLLLILLRPSPVRAAVWTMALTGGMTMALQIILIFLFQNRYGVIYQQIGLLYALFMAGLACGGLLGRLAVGFGAAPSKTLPALELLLAILAGLTALTAWGRLPDMILPLVACAGLISGLEFALLFALYLTDSSRPSVTRALAGLEAADHGGAVIGALVTGLLLAPVLGLGVTAAALAGLKVLGGAVLLRQINR